MDATTRKRLEAAGWRTGTVAELLGLTPAESAFIEMKLALARTVRTLRERRHLSQDQAAAALGSSQSRISKIEAADRSVSLDLLVRFALDLGATRRDVAEAGQSAADLPLDHGFRAPGLALGEGLADTHDRHQPRRGRRAQLLGDTRVGLTEELAALRPGQWHHSKGARGHFGGMPRWRPPCRDALWSHLARPNFRRSRLLRCSLGPSSFVRGAGLGLQTPTD